MYILIHAQALVPQLTHPLIPLPLVEPRVDLQLASVRALAVVIEECKPRIAGWRLTILDAVARCWVDWCDKDDSKFNLRCLIFFLLN